MFQSKLAAILGLKSNTSLHHAGLQQEVSLAENLYAFRYPKQ